MNSDKTVMKVCMILFLFLFLTASIRGKDLPFQERVKTIRPSFSQIKRRVLEGKPNAPVEPIFIPLEKASRMGKSDSFKTLFSHQPVVLRENKKYIRWTEELLEHSSYDALANFYSIKTLELFLQTEKLTEDQREQILGEVSSFLPPEEISVLKNKLSSKIPVSVKTNLLPRFARAAVGKFTVYQGPNCFHASIAFHNRSAVQSPFINVSREENYHHEMINHDELLRILQSQFYPVALEKTQLKYGDVIVFVDQKDSEKIDDFKMLKHAAVMLFHPYVFSKGSKSANSAYSIKKLDAEKILWTKYFKNIRLKVFRKASPKLSQKTPINLQEWLQ